MFNISDKVKKIVFVVSVGLFAVLVISDIVLGFAGVNIPARVDGVGEVVKIIAAAVGFISGKALK